MADLSNAEVLGLIQSGDYQAIANAGLTGEQIQNATLSNIPGYSAASSASNASTANYGGTDYNALTNQLYQQYLGRPAESGVAQEWAKVGGTAQDIANALAASQEYQSRANIVNLYQNVFQRNPETEGLGYWASRFGSTLEPAEISAFVNAAQAEKPGAFYTPPVTSAAAPGVDYNALVNLLYQTHLGRPAESGVAQEWAKVGGSEQDITNAILKSQEYGSRAGVVNLYENVLGRNPNAVELSRLSSIFGPTIEPHEIDAFVKFVQKEKPGAVYNPKLGDYIPETVQQLSTLAPERYNAATTFAGIAQNVYGMTEEEARNLGINLLQGKETDSQAKQFYDQLVSGGMTPRLQELILKDAAQKNPNAPIFQKNPELKLAYTPLETQSGSSGQYGYYKNAPILNAAFAEDKLGNKNQTQLALDQDSTFGWATNSKYVGEVKRGPALLGINFGNREDVEKAIAIEEGIRSGTVFGDPEGGYYSYAGDGINYIRPPTYENYRQQYLPTVENTRQKLDKAAAELGIDPRQYTSPGDLYDAIEAKTGNLYQVSGKAAGWDPEVAQASGITKTNAESSGVNSATVLYKQVGDKLIPVSAPKAFEFKDPKNQSRGFFGDLAQAVGGFLSIPPVAIALAAAGGIPGLLGYTPAGVGAGASSALGLSLQEAGQKVLGSALLNAGTSALTTGLRTLDLEKAGLAGLSSGIGAGVSGGLPLLLGDVAKDFSISPGTLKVASQIAGGAAAKAVTGQDPGQYLINRLLGAGLGALASIGAEKAGIPTKGAGADLFKAMLPIITTKRIDPNDVVRLAQAVKSYEKSRAQG